MNWSNVIAFNAAFGGIGILFNDSIILGIILLRIIYCPAPT